MQVLHAPEELRSACTEARHAGKRVGLVPTMGALHRGHATLIEAACERTAFPVVTIFVNPTQFGPHEDLARYPRTLEADLELCAKHGAAAVFVPEPQAMYTEGEETRVAVGRTAEELCGRSRPNHFEGVATIVAKLFALVGPAHALFGRKDYQQLAVIKRMASDLFLPIQIEGVATVREPDGLALSSRNRYLDVVARERALGLVRGLAAAATLFDAGERTVGTLREACLQHVQGASEKIDYVTLADPETVRSFSDDQLAPERVLLAIAAHVGGARLIDNAVLGEDVLPPIAP